MTGPDGWLFLLGLALLAAGAICAHHIPGLSTVVDGTDPYTARTETDDSWLRELPATQEDQ